MMIGGGGMMIGGGRMIWGDMMIGGSMMMIGGGGMMIGGDMMKTIECIGRGKRGERGERNHMKGGGTTMMTIDGCAMTSGMMNALRDMKTNKCVGGG